MKFNPNKEFTLSQLLEYFKNAISRFGVFLKKADSESIKSISIRGRKIRINSLRLCVITAASAIFVALFLNLFIIPHMSMHTYSDLEFDTGGDYTQYEFKNDILLLNKSGIKLVGQNGSDIWSNKYTLTNPMVDVSKSHILLTDLGGNHSITLLNSDGDVVKTYEVNRDIISAKLSDNSLVAAALEEDGYKGSVTVFNKKGEEIFKWNSGEGYISDIDISKNGKYIVVSRILSDKEEAYSKINVIKISNGKTVSSIECEKSLVGKICFNKSGDIIAVAGTGVYGYTKNGTKKFYIDLMGKSAETYDVENGNNLIFLCRDSRGNSVLEIYKQNGKLRGSYTSADEIKNITTSDDKIVAATSRFVISLSQRGKKKKSVEISHDIMSIGIYGNNKNALVLGGNKANIVRIK